MKNNEKILQEINSFVRDLDKKVYQLEEEQNEFVKILEIQLDALVVIADNFINDSSTDKDKIYADIYHVIEEIQKHLPGYL